MTNLIKSRSGVTLLYLQRASDRIDPRTILNSGGGGPKMQYKARPLNGIWATAPYLHNGSVPNLQELLLPPEQRSKTFGVGRRDFDPQNVGFQTGEVPGTFTFDTSRPGNSNSGHVYGTRLSASDRQALLEYLKSI